MRSRWSQGRGPRGTRASTACAGHRAGKACPGAGPCTASEPKAEKKERFTALLHHIDVDLLRSAYSWLKRDAAPGVDGMTWEQYEQNLEANLVDLHARVHRGAYRAQPSRRKYIPKPDGRQRPLGSRRWRTRSSSGRWWKCSTRSTRRISWGSPTGSGPGAASTMRWTHSRSGSPDAGELDRGRRHPSLFRHGEPRMADAVRGTPYRRPAHDPPDPQMAEGRGDGRRGVESSEAGTPARCGDLADCWRTSTCITSSTCGRSNGASAMRPTATSSWCATPTTSSSASSTRPTPSGSWRNCGTGWRSSR